MCPQVLTNYSNKLDLTKPGWFIDGAKEKAMVFFKVNQGMWYISSGHLVAKKFGFTEPTLIYLYPRLNNNEFLMFEKYYHKILKNAEPPAYKKQIFLASESDKDDKHNADHESPEDDNEHGEDDNEYAEDDNHNGHDDQAYEIDPTPFYEFNVNVTDAMANSIQVLHFPNKTSKHVLAHNQQQIYVRDVDSGRVFNCVISTASRNKYERYIGEGNGSAIEVSQSKIAMFHGMSSMTENSTLSYSNLENVQPMDSNPNCISIINNTSIVKRKADRIPLSPLNPDSILTPNTSQDINLTIQSKRMRTPNPKYFSPTSCFINTLEDSMVTPSKSSRLIEYQKGSTSAFSQVTNSPSSGVINPTLKTTDAKYSRKVPLINKYIGVQRLDFDDDTHGSHDVVDKLNVFKSTLYATSESEVIINFGLPEFTCKYCSAELWYEERSDKSTNGLQVDFSICCQKGEVVLPLLKKPPKLLLDLINGNEPRSRNYKENIRAYNSMFAFTSMGGEINDNINNGGGPPQFILGGQNYHRIGSLLPEAGTTPKFAQLYVFDTQNEANNRAACFRSSNKKKDTIDISLVKDLQDMIHSFNPLAKAYRKVRDSFQSGSGCQLSLRLYRNRDKDSRMHNIPTADEVAGLIVGDFEDSDIGRDVIINERQYGLTRIHETHVLFLPLQYPLIFPRGENGWEPDIPRTYRGELPNNKKRERVTIREFIAFRLQERTVEFGNILSSKRLFQQFVVDCYTMLEAQRLSFIRENQPNIRQDILSGLQEAVDRGDVDASLVGKRIIIPDSF
ncbi:ATP-dependent DNA helicase PIF1, partial [Trifolium medium]|nr:ATP-dependent DNA helicase PIF1 [Trifolium medium]